MLSLGALIWVSVRPLLRLSLCTLCGFIITKADIFPPVAARGTGQILLNITLPALMFSRIVPAFTSDNVSALGPLVLVAILYEALGIFIAWVAKQVFWVPHRFRYGILVAGGWSNVGDVPTAVIMSISGSAPFNGSTDQTVAVAYLSAFILVFFITLFPMGGVRLIALDYAGPDVDDDDLRKGVPAKTRESLGRITRGLSVARRRVVGRKHEGRRNADLERSEEGSKGEGPRKDRNENRDDTEKDEKERVVSEADYFEVVRNRESESNPIHPQPPTVSQPSRCQCGKHVSFLAETDPGEGSTDVPTERVFSPSCSATATAIDSPSRVTSPTPSITRIDAAPITTARDFDVSANKGSANSNTSIPSSVGPSTTTRPRSRATRHVLLAHAKTILVSMLTTQTITIFVALLVALVPQLKALFTPVYKNDGETLIPNAPDGQPPLAFILDTASFIGAASVPMGLICLGAALAQLQVPRSPTQWRSFPLGAIFALAIGKMIIMPIVGVLVVQGLTDAGVIDSDDKVLRFVCIFLSCIPTATTQVFLTQVYSGTGEASTLSAFLIPQYALMFVTMTILSAYTLSLLF